MDGNAQPALLYLVPFTAIPPILIAIYRKEFKQLWNGPESHFDGLPPEVQSTNFEERNREDNLLIDGQHSMSNTANTPKQNGL